MSRIHDLGGKEGYGPIDVNEPEEQFHHEWEAREWGMSRSAEAAPGLTIDWWRHIRELIMPDDYINRPYFDSWAQTDLAAYINAGVISMDEAISGNVERTTAIGENVLRLSTKQQAVHEDHNRAERFDGEIATTVQFQIDDGVSTVREIAANHTRLPEYARNKSGRICAYHGAHVFPDLSAQGKQTYQHLYSVEFECDELWGESNGFRDKVYLDLWESYLLAKGG